MEYFARFLISYASYRLSFIYIGFTIQLLFFISANLFFGLLFFCLFYFHLYNAKKLYAFCWFYFCFFVFLSEYFAKRNSLVRALNFSLFEVLNIIYTHIYRRYMYTHRTLYTFLFIFFQPTWQKNKLKWKCVCETLAYRLQFLSINLMFFVFVFIKFINYD